MVKGLQVLSKLILEMNVPERCDQKAKGMLPGAEACNGNSAW